MAEGMEVQVGRAGSEDWYNVRARPSNELPVVLGLSQVIGEAEGVLVAIGAARVHANGFGLDLMVRLRGGPPAGLGQRIYSVLDHHFGGSVALSDRLLLGVEYADGRRGSNLDEEHQGPDGDPQAVVLSYDGGGGGGQAHDHTLWVSPLPPPGPLTLVCLWPVAGIPETATVLDGAAIAEAAGRVRQLWPWEPDRYDEEPPLPPQRPATGWFADLD